MSRDAKFYPWPFPAQLPRSPGDPAFDGAEESLRQPERATAPGDFLRGLSSAERKTVALFRGLFKYFPDALALVARHSYRSNEKHNPGQPLHWNRGKSDDHADCILRHVMGFGELDDGQPNEIGTAWRALAALQLDYEANPEKYR